MSKFVKELEGPPLIKGFALVLTNELDNEPSKLKDKWAGEFDDLSDLFKDNILSWTVDYVKLNNDMSICISESCESLIQVEREIFKMKIKQEIIVPPPQDFISR